ncbi:NAD(+)/NADH kinase [Candidatus Bathyarchaeota archaeon]|nr:NAD(+)/NADH kinase [Candidatus Bathyarchaeota archaeon]
MKVGIVSRTDIPSALTLTKRILCYLDDRGVDTSVETDTALALELNDDNTNLNELEGDFMVTVGGDGTILKTAMEMKVPGTPILGVNMGRRGFLSEVMVPEAEWALDMVIEGDYFVEESMKVSSRCLQLEDSFPDGLNEVLIASPLPSKMVLLGLSVDGEHILDVQADGIIVSTPAGSTAYNMSAGGSVVAPGVDAFCITAICPYSYFKSIVVPPESIITIELLKPKAEAVAIIDGRAFRPLQPLNTIECYLSEQKTRFIRFRSFYSRIQKRILTIQSR